MNIKKYTPTKKNFRRLYLKLIRQPGSPEYIARGVAIGLFFGFLIPMGGQIFFAVAAAFLLKGHKILAISCTWVTNHASIIIIYPVQCYIGSYIMGAPLSMEKIDSMFTHLFEHISLENLLKLGAEITIPFFIGGALFGTVSAFMGYFIVYGIMVKHHKRVEERRRQRLIRRREKMV